MLAVSVMSAGVQTFCFLVAVIVFVIAFVLSVLPPAGTPRPSWRAWNWVALGLAFFAFVFFWNAWAAN